MKEHLECPRCHDHSGESVGLNRAYCLRCGLNWNKRDGALFDAALNLRRRITGILPFRKRETAHIGKFSNSGRPADD
jgi:hypothetical protein